MEGGKEMRALTLNEIEIVNGATKGTTVIDFYFSAIGFWGLIGGVTGVILASACYNSIIASSTLTSLGTLVPFAGLGAGVMIGGLIGEGLYYLNKYDII